MAKTVFVKNNVHVLCRLLITRRPSATTFGSEPKFESRATKWAVFFVASVPEAMAMEQSATFKAKISLTPSPVIATVCPHSWSVSTITCFCSGETRPKTVYLFAIKRTSSNDIPSSEINLLAPGTPTLSAI